MKLKHPAGFENEFATAKIAAIFAAYPKTTRERLLRLRRLIFDTAAETTGVGELEETLKWGQLSYLTPVTKSGSTIRIDRVNNGKADYAIYFHCQTSLVDSFRLIFGDTFKYEGNRAILFNDGDEIPVEALRQCISMALTYHLDKQ